MDCQGRDQPKICWIQTFDTLFADIMPLASIFFLFADWMYISDWRLDAIIRLNKLTAGNEEYIAREGSTNRLYGVKVYSIKEQQMLPNHPCTINNGGCEKICFAVPGSSKVIGLRVRNVSFYGGVFLERGINTKTRLSSFRYNADAHTVKNLPTTKKPAFTIRQRNQCRQLVRTNGISHATTRDAFPRLGFATETTTVWTIPTKSRTARVSF